MKKNNKSGLLVGILIGIIILLIIVIGLLATNTISFSSKVNGDSEHKMENKDKSDENDEEIEDSDNLDNEKYASIIEEYKKALNDKDFNNNVDTEKTYPNINENIIHLYHSYGTPNALKYVFYDVNSDGKNEMIVGDGDNSIYEIYTYDGVKAIRFYNENCLGERCNSSIYDNGIIYFYGSGGASIHGLDFYKIASDGYSKDTFKSYSVEYDSNGNVTITDELTKAKTNYKADDEVINDVVGSAKKIDLSKLGWIEIK